MSSASRVPLLKRLLLVSRTLADTLPRPDVYSVEVYKELHESARKNLDSLGYKNVHLRHDDGSEGWKEHAPFDAVIVTCASSHIPPKIVEQLEPGGRMCIPVGPPFGVQRLLLVQKSKEGKITTRTITMVRFVPLLPPQKKTNDQKKDTPQKSSKGS